MNKKYLFNKGMENLKLNKLSKGKHKQNRDYDTLKD